MFGSQIKLKKDPDFEGHLFKTRTDLSSLHTMSMLQSDNQGPLLIHLFVYLFNCLLIYSFCISVCECGHCAHVKVRGQRVGLSFYHVSLGTELKSPASVANAFTHEAFLLALQTS